MAATQQIVRITAGVLQNCSCSERELHELISFNLSAPEDDLDLDWAPAGLEIYFQRSGQGEESIRALRLALDGARVLNPVHVRSAFDYTVDSDITMLWPAEVEDVADGFAQINWNSLEKCMPESIEEALRILNSDLECHPNDYYLPYLEKLKKFVVETTKKGMGLAQWWD